MTLDDFADTLRSGNAAPYPGLTLAQAYAVAARNHALRAAHDAPVGRKIGHTNTANWPTQNIDAPSWGWLYASSTQTAPAQLSLSAWREPKVELECVLRLGPDGRPAAMALGLEIVDRPYADWQITVADSVAANGVHAALLLGPWQAVDPALLERLQAELQVGAQRSQGGSALVVGSPLQGVARLTAVLAAQGAAPLQAGEIITTGALAPALHLRAGASLHAHITGFTPLQLLLSCP